MLEIDTFRALCKKVTKEKDPSELEILKDQMRVLLMDRRHQDHSSEVFIN
jgi:hypothetical protein